MTNGLQETNNHLRRNTFWTLAVTIFGSVIFLDWINWEDAALQNYAIDAAIEGICGLMFADWWRVKGSASSIYKWLTFLLFSLFINDCAQFVVRYVWIYYPTFYQEWISTVWWGYRTSPKTLALIYLLSFAIWQRYGKQSTYSDGIRQDMANGFEKLSAQIVAGELKFEGHSHTGLVIGAKIILKPLTGTNSNVTETETVTTTITTTGERR